MSVSAGTYQCVYPAGVYVRSLPDVTSTPAGEMDEGDLCELTGKSAVDSSGIIWVETKSGLSAAGWIRSEKDNKKMLKLVAANTGSTAAAPAPTPPPIPVPTHLKEEHRRPSIIPTRGTYQCIYPHGAYIRATPDPRSDPVGEVDEGDLVELSGQFETHDDGVTFVETTAKLGAQGWIRYEKDGVLTLKLISKVTKEPAPVKAPAKAPAIAPIVAPVTASKIVAPVAVQKAVEPVVAPKVVAPVVESQPVLAPDPRPAPPAPPTAASAPEAALAKSGGGWMGFSNPFSSKKKAAAPALMPTPPAVEKEHVSKVAFVEASSDETDDEHAFAPSEDMHKHAEGKHAHVTHTPDIPVAVSSLAKPASMIEKHLDMAHKETAETAVLNPEWGAHEGTTQQPQEGRKMPEVKVHVGKEDYQAALSIHARQKQEWLAEKRQMQVEYRKERDALLMENAQLKRSLNNADAEGKLMRMHEDFVRLQHDTGFLEKDLMDAQQAVEEMRHELHSVKSYAAAEKQMFEAASIQWKEREEEYVIALEKVGKRKLAQQLAHEEEKREQEYVKQRLLYDGLAHEGSLRNSSPNRAKNDALFSSVKEYRKSHKRTPSPSTKPLFHPNDLKFTDKVTSLTLYADKGSASRSASPKVTGLRASHRTVASPEMQYRRGEHDLPHSPASSPSVLDPASTPSFQRKHTTHKEDKDIYVAKVRNTIVFTSNDPNIFLSNQAVSKCDERGPGSPISKEKLNADRLSTLGHYSAFTTAAAKKKREYPKASLVGGTKTFKFTSSATTDHLVQKQNLHTLGTIAKYRL